MKSLNIRFEMVLMMKVKDILVFDSESYGRVLVLDGVIQVTEKDEFIYHEMMVHVPMAVHPNARRVLIIGAGDGGVVLSTIHI